MIVYDEIWPFFVFPAGQRFQIFQYNTIDHNVHDEGNLTELIIRKLEV